jgi:peptidoglycan-associated lipoprotein
MGFSKQAIKLSMVGILGLALAACSGASKTDMGSGGNNGMSSGGSSTSVSLPNDGSQYVATGVLDRVFFDTDKSTINSASRSVLAAQAKWLSANASTRVLIEGHADERGTRDYNLALGARRAAAVRDVLLSLGVSAGQVQTISYGKERPVSTCSQPSCWSKNRRAVTTIQ